MKSLKPYVTFWIFIPLFVITGFLLPSSMEFSVYTDNYTLIPVNISVFLASFLLLSGIGYFIIRSQELNVNFYKSHTKYTLIGALICAFSFLILYFHDSGKTVAEFQAESDSFSLDQFLAMTFMFGILMLFIGFMVYLTYIILALFFQDKVDSN